MKKRLRMSLLLLALIGVLAPAALAQGGPNAGKPPADAPAGAMTAGQKDEAMGKVLRIVGGVAIVAIIGVVVFRRKS